MWRFSHPAASGPQRWLWSRETSGGSRQSHQPGYASEPSRLCPLARTDASRPGPTLAGRDGCGRGPLLRPRAIRGWDYCLIDSSIPQKQPAQPVGASSVPMPAFLSFQFSFFKLFNFSRLVIIRCRSSWKAGLASASGRVCASWRKIFSASSVGPSASWLRPSSL
jgi:hypothetical protein